MLSAVVMKLPFGCLPLPSLQMWSTAEHLRYHVRCFSKYERRGRGTLSEMALASIPLRDGLRDGGDSSWFPRQSLSLQLWEHM